MIITESTLKYGQSTQVTGGIQPPNVPFWEYENGELTGQYTNVVTIVPYNRTGDYDLNLYPVKYWAGNSTLDTDMALDGNNIAKVSGGEVVSVAYVSGTAVSLGDRTALLEAGFDTLSTKSMGFGDILATTGLKCFWFVSGSTAYCYMEEKIVHKENIVSGDRLKLKLYRGKRAQFYKNGKLVKQAFLNTGLTQGYPMIRMGSYVAGAKIYNPIFFLDTVFDTMKIKTYAVFPTQPTYPYDYIEDDNTFFSAGEDGSKLTKYRPAPDVLVMTLRNRTFTETAELRQFWNDHKKLKAFYYEDLVFDNERLFKFNAPLKTTGARSDLFDINLGMEAARVYEEIPPPLTTSQAVTLDGETVTLDGEVVTYA